MKKVITTKKQSEVDLGSISVTTPIFAMKHGKLIGMIVEEPKEGWMLRIGGPAGSS